MEARIKSLWTIKGSVFTALAALLFLAEASQAEIMLLEIPGFPLSVGRLLFVLIGLFYLARYSANPPVFVYGLYLVVIGSFFGAMFSNHMGPGISRAVANLLLLTASIGIAKLWRMKYGKLLLNAFFIFTYIYWTVYILQLTLVGGTIVSYGSIYDQTLFVNHHVMGIQLSLSTIYILFNFFYKKKISLMGYLFILVSLIVLILTESRVNFLITLLLSGYILFTSLKGRIVTIFLAFLFVLGFAYSFKLISSVNEDLSRRFDTSDSEYISRTSYSRLGLAQGAWETFVNNPLGKGLEDTRVEYNGHRYQAHNLYLTFLISSGFLGLIGVVVWMLGFSEVSVRLGKGKDNLILALNFICVAYMLTAMSSDNFGLLFFLVVSWQIHLSDFSKLQRGIQRVIRFSGSRQRSGIQEIS